MKLLKRIQAVAPSATMALSGRAKELAIQGKDVINLSIDRPDFNTLSFIDQAAVKAISENLTDSYAPADGLPELRQKVAERINSEHKTKLSSQSIAVTTGTRYTLCALAQILLNPRDEVLIPSPYWVSYGEQVKLAGAKPTFVRPEKDLKVTPTDLQEHTHNVIKMLVINSPNNSSGQVHTKAELIAIRK